MASTVELIGGLILIRSDGQRNLMRPAFARLGGDDCDDWYETVG